MAEEATAEGVIQSQIIITYGFDGDGDSACWVQATPGSMVELLGMLEFAKRFIIQAAESADSG